MARGVSAAAATAGSRQRLTPLADALDRQRIDRLAHFDVPAHKSGRGNPELTEYLGARAMVESFYPCHSLTAKPSGFFLRFYLSDLVIFLSPLPVVFNANGAVCGVNCGVKTSFIVGQSLISSKI